MTSPVARTPFEVWWFNTGSGLIPKPNEDRAEHARRVAEAAFYAGSEAALEDPPARSNY